MIGFVIEAQKSIMGKVENICNQYFNFFHNIVKSLITLELLYLGIVWK